MSCGCSKPLVRFNELDAYACAHFGIAPDSSGLVRWARMNWRGVPFPLRLWFVLRIAARGHQIDAVGALERFTGCGCIDSMKTWAERVFPS